MFTSPTFADLSTIVVNAATLPAVPANPLRFTKAGTFQLSVFEDLHYGEAEDLVWGPQQDINTTRVMNTILDVETPQLVVLNGDLITGEDTFLHNSTHYIDEIVAPLIRRDLKWASTYGNHDSQFNLSRKDILKREHLWSNSLTQSMLSGKSAGVSNYYLPVFSANRNDETPELIIWFFDSRGGFYFQEVGVDGDGLGQPDWVDQSVVDWFTETKNTLRTVHKKSIPSLAFVHIPVNAMLAFQNTTVHPHKEPGINDDVPLAQQAQGWAPDGSNDSEYGGQDIPFMAALLDTSGLMGVFSGHDHGDDWCFKWSKHLPNMTLTPSPSNPINLCFGRHTGYGGYGNWIRGSRQILVNKSELARNTVQTWIRMEDESISGSITLNSTYGQDKYPSVPTIYS